MLLAVLLIFTIITTGQTGNDETKDVEISKQFLEKSRNAIN